jgi:hypothetical protein
MGRVRSIHERSSCCILFVLAAPASMTAPANELARPKSPNQLTVFVACIPGWAPQVRTMTVSRARSASGFTVAPLNFRREAACTLVTCRQFGHSYATKPGSSVPGGIVTTSFIAVPHRAQVAAASENRLITSAQRRSTFSSALNFRRSAIAALVRSP